MKLNQEIRKAIKENAQVVADAFKISELEAITRLQGKAAAEKKEELLDLLCQYKAELIGL